MFTPQENKPLGPLTTFGIGGPARWYAEASDVNSLTRAMNWAAKKNLPVFLLGGGSNLLVADDGFPGLVIHLANRSTTIQNTGLRTGAGTPLIQVVQQSARGSLSGLERLAGIPGTIGGAVRGNAGAFGTEIKDAVEWVRAVHRQSGEVRLFSRDECNFSYRHSFFKQGLDWIIMETLLSLRRDFQTDLDILIKQTIAQRNAKHIQDIQSAGSSFINPAVKNRALRQQFETEAQAQCRGQRVPAGWLMDKAGLRGKQIGGAMFSAIHPNYCLNTGNATADHVMALLRTARRRVHDQFSIQLQLEIQLVGLAL